MPTIRIKTIVAQDWKTVKSGFNKNLFLALNPPFPKVKLLRFDGCKTGDIVSLELNFLLFRQKWISKITEDKILEKAFYFIDKGTSTPFFLKFWEHTHTIRAYKGKTLITDQIHFRTLALLTDLLFYPLLYLQFLYRKPIYKKRFKIT